MPAWFNHEDFMQKLKSIAPALAVAFLLASLIGCVSGCATTQTTAGKLLASTAITVDGAMQGWATWVAAGQSNPQQEAQVKAAYQKYQASMALASSAYAALAAGGDKTAWETAANLLTANQNALLAIITSFQGAK